MFIHNKQLRRVVLSTSLALFYASASDAGDIKTANPDFKLRLDTTAKCSARGR